MVHRRGGHGRGGGGDVTGVDHAGLAIAGRHHEAACLPDHRVQGEKVLHIGVGPQKRLRKGGGLQVRLDLGLSAPPADR